MADKDLRDTRQELGKLLFDLWGMEHEGMERPGTGVYHEHA